MEASKTPQRRSIAGELKSEGRRGATGAGKRAREPHHLTPRRPGPISATGPCLRRTRPAMTSIADTGCSYAGKCTVHCFSTRSGNFLMFQQSALHRECFSAMSSHFDLVSSCSYHFAMRDYCGMSLACFFLGIPISRVSSGAGRTGGAQTPPFWV
ncbi:hypothetical protein M8818_003319 [Zalaria obscura]|uniref:Uncharacterized protein n=1 Tax=Zalaria obscura TaxID=2024903 RepID=A0ACC3SGR7_9PEZI